MAALPLFRRSLCLSLGALLLLPAGGFPQQSRPAVPTATSSLELVAVLDLEAVGSDKVQASAMTDRLREELLKTGKYILVNREQIDAVLNEQAFQQTGCTTSECAVKVGQVLGVRKLVTGRVTKLDERHWQLSANVIDVESAQTLRSESIQYEGDFFSLLSTGIGSLVAKLTAEKPGLPAIVQAAPPAGTAAATEPPKEEKPKSSSKWWWIAGGAAVVAVAVASQSKSGGGGGGGGGGCPTSSCGSVTGHW